MTANRQLSKYRHCPTSDAGFYPCLKSCALHPKSTDGICDSADDPVRIVGKKEIRIQFQKEYLKVVSEEPTAVMPTEMEKLVRELPRDRHAFKRNSDECMIARSSSSRIRNKSCLTLGLPFQFPICDHRTTWCR